MSVLFRPFIFLPLATWVERAKLEPDPVQYAHVPTIWPHPILDPGATFYALPLAQQRKQQMDQPMYLVVLRKSPNRCVRSARSFQHRKICK